MLVKLILAVFALIVMLGTRSYADDSSMYSSSQGSSSSSSADFIQQPLNQAKAAEDKAEKRDAEIKEQINSMFSDDADVPGK